MPSDDSPPGAPTEARRSAEPIFDAPFVVVALVTVLLVIQLGANLIPEQAEHAIVGQFAFIPGRITVALWPSRFDDLLARANSNPEAWQQARLARNFNILHGLIVRIERAHPDGPRAVQGQIGLLRQC